MADSRIIDIIKTILQGYVFITVDIKDSFSPVAAIIVMVCAGSLLRVLLLDLLQWALKNFI